MIKINPFPIFYNFTLLMHYILTTCFSALQLTSVDINKYIYYLHWLVLYLSHPDWRKGICVQYLMYVASNPGTGICGDWSGTGSCKTSWDMAPKRTQADMFQDYEHIKAQTLSGNSQVHCHKWITNALRRPSHKTYRALVTSQREHNGK